MCGIAGVVKFPGGEPLRADDLALQAMSGALAHRGPDGSGVYVDPRGRAALVHRRLAIIDLPGGGQPMGSEDGLVQVVFNGEIYNHRELRRELESLGHRFATDHSDTEVLVHGWEAWGEELPTKLVGMFAFGVWDGRGDGTLFFARDRMGQKPLFYAALEDGVVFGSTLPSVLAWPEVPRRVPRELLAVYLQLGYMPAPLTIYRDVSQVVPGHWVRLRGGVMDGRRYWSGMAEGSRKLEVGSQKAGAELRRALVGAVESQLMADVPIACFLSGGIDSSIIAALMQEIVRGRGGDAIHTVSVGFREAAFDETPYSDAVAAKIGSRHTRLVVDSGADAGGAMGTLRMLMRTSLGEPFADSSILPTYHLSKSVRELAPVALSGDGADELFGGYDRYRAMVLLRRWKNVARLMPRSAPVGSLAKRERYRRLAAAARAGNLAEQYTRLVEIFSPEDVQGLMGEVADEFEPTDVTPTDPLRHAMMRDQVEYLPGDVLWKVDSASMAEALEVRSPFLDHRVVELANGLGNEEILNGGVSKAILRREFAAELPEMVRGRGKKGFGVDIGGWFRGVMRDELREALLARDSFCAMQLQRGAVERLVEEHQSQARDHTHRLFALLMLEIWAREFRPVIE